MSKTFKDKRIKTEEDAEMVRKRKSNIKERAEHRENKYIKRYGRNRFAYSDEDE